ncbi:MAG: radical SAM protein [Ruminococcaceae bacterium]|nr:radical SAM protein [Oscillospiraceae bacterium]
MTVTYTVDGGLYINVTNRCTNRCDFCIRNNGDGAYGSESLWLEREPTEEEILASVFSHDLDSIPEVVFCGYGEPSVRLDVVRGVALKIKEKHPNIKIRINTNGQSDLILGRDSAPLYKDAFDTVSISLNAPTKERYQEICHSVYGEIVLEKIIEFAKNVNKYVQNTIFSVVKESLTSEEIEKCREIANECGVKLRVRDLIT